MDYSDHPHPFFTGSLSCEDTPKYSVGYYRGRHRVVIGWFMRLEDAERFSQRAQSRFPLYKIDVLKSFF